ncbi:hypothetical protein SAMN05443429_11249 [Cruoricaptor ignavus]|uniref:Uncharacterized protein n=1 Tax=Cruoricaptor ignavus TaxID=1118202 RepID=A0A1M6HFW2_9FLAO|nr:hypothetical protein [Cruoricaptor ignavus]SHJ21096.1 hypothetical protein SAMN05443429_11249 [Cruoricaptor ignavus]
MKCYRVDVANGCYKGSYTVWADSEEHAISLLKAKFRREDGVLSFTAAYENWLATEVDDDEF